MQIPAATFIVVSEDQEILPNNLKGDIEGYKKKEWISPRKRLPKLCPLQIDSTFPFVERHAWIKLDMLCLSPESEYTVYNMGLPKNHIFPIISRNT